MSGRRFLFKSILGLAAYGAANSVRSEVVENKSNGFKFIDKDHAYHYSYYTNDIKIKRTIKEYIELVEFYDLREFLGCRYINTNHKIIGSEKEEYMLTLYPKNEEKNERLMIFGELRLIKKLHNVCSKIIESL